MTDPVHGPDPPPGPLATVDAVEQALHRQLELLLQRLKQCALEVVDEVGRKHGEPLTAQLRQALTEATGSLLKAEVKTLVEGLKPALLESTGVLRQDAAGLVGDLKQFITRTVAEVFREHVPEYSRWAGQRLIAYFLGCTLFCLAAVLVLAGCVLALQQAGLPGYAACLAGGGLALAGGVTLLKLRRRRWDSAADRPASMPAAPAPAPRS